MAEPALPDPSGRCSSCGCELPARAKFCLECGAAQVGAPRTPPATDSTPSIHGERRQLTVMFCDLVGSTAVAEQLDPEDLHAVLRAYQEACTRVIERFEGYLAKYLGDGLLVYFGYPQAHEDDAHRAVRAGLGIVAAIGLLADRILKEHGVPLAARVGIHTGLVVVGEVGGEGQRAMDIVGETPSVAARLQELASPNSVVLTEATHHLVTGYFDCQEWGRRDLKGISHPVLVYQALHESTARSRLQAASTSHNLTPMVGREAALELLHERWEEARAGRGQVLLLSGEAGMGKSRLVEALKRHVAEDPSAWLTEIYGSAYHQNSPLFPFAELLERVVLRYERDDPPAEKLRKLEGVLVEYGIPLAEMVPLYASLLSLPLGDAYAPSPLTPRQQRERLLEALALPLLHRAGRQPVLFVAEDLHWIDPTTLELLHRLVAAAPEHRILVLLTYRPSFVPAWPVAGAVTWLPLERLRAAEMETMVLRVTGGKPVPPEVLRQIATKTDGVPLFIEELTRMVIESDLLAEDEGAYALTGPLPPLAIPATLHDSLVARLDRLATVKEVAHWAAALGREFSGELLAAVAPVSEATLDRALAELAAAELIYPQAASGGERTYRFKHALIRDAAYESLLKSRRQQFHQRIATVLERQFPETAASRPELLAHHFTEAGLVEPAARYWLQAGLRARERVAEVEAMEHLAKGLALLRTLAESPARDALELQFLGPLGTATIAARGYADPEIGPVFRRARELSARSGQPPQLFAMMRGTFAWHVVRGDFRLSMKLANEAVDLARELDDPGILMEALLLPGVAMLYRGDFAGTRGHCAEALAAYDDRERTAFWAGMTGEDSGVVHRCYLALALWHLGYPDQALQVNQEMRELARAIGHPYSLAYALHHTGWLFQHCRLGAQAQAAGEEAIAIATEQGFSFWQATGTLYRGAGMVLQGRLADGLPLLASGLAAYRATGAGLAVPYYLSLLGDAHRQAGRFEDARRVLDEGLALVEQNDDRFQEAELRRLTGELLLGESPDHAAAAEACFHEAIAIARRQQSRAWELRCTLSLARLWQQQGRRDAARGSLAAVSDRYTEGLTTPDLVDAAALLRALA
jgi:class 3 adenylate cyclase/predicted ATPase